MGDEMERFRNRNEQQWSILRSLEVGVSLLFRDLFNPQLLETNSPPFLKRKYPLA